MAQSSQAASSSSTGDQAVAFAALKDSKFCLSALAMAATESSNNQFRAFLTSSLSEVMNEHFMLSDILINKGWYTPANVRQQLQNDLQRAPQLHNGQANNQLNPQ